MALPGHGEADAHAGFLGWVRRNVPHRDIRTFPNQRTFVVMQPDSASATYAFHRVAVVPQPAKGHVSKLLRVAELALSYLRFRREMPGPGAHAAFVELQKAGEELR